LSALQYDNTARALLGVTDSASTLLPAETDQLPAVTDYQAAADFLTAQVMSEPVLLAAILPCTDDNAACIEEFITSFGLRAFRRPLQASEIAQHGALYEDRANLTTNGTFAEAIELILQTMLASPHFVSRTELSSEAEGDFYALNDYEMASRLSYMLWANMPDAQLFDAAAGGELSTKTQLLAQARRMLADPKARDQVAAFHRFYARMGPSTRWTWISKDPMLFPAFDEAQGSFMLEETALVFDTVVFERGAFQELLTTTTAFVNQSLAPIYGLDPSGFGAELQRVELGLDRPGVFTRAGFLTAYASPTQTSPILRGAFLLSQVLCLDVGAPPPGTALPMPETEELLTVRQETEGLTSPAACAACHVPYIDPLGFALEGFDAVGSVQTIDNGQPVDTAAAITIDTQGSQVEVDGAADLMHTLADAPQAQQCYARKWVEYATERPLTASDACLVNQLAANMRAQDYPILDLLAELTQADSFRLRAP
jgi:hypothetical protein